METAEQLEAHDELRTRIDALSALLRQHDCSVDGLRSVGECVDRKLCGCSCALLLGGST